jgi:hypothetical protein
MARSWRRRREEELDVFQLHGGEELAVPLQLGTLGEDESEATVRGR